MPNPCIKFRIWCHVLSLRSFQFFICCGPSTNIGLFDGVQEGWLKGRGRGADFPKFNTRPQADRPLIRRLRRQAVLEEEQDSNTPPLPFAA